MEPVLRAQLCPKGCHRPLRPVRESLRLVGVLTILINLITPLKRGMWGLYWIIYQLVNLPLMALGLPIIAILVGLRLWYERPSLNPMFAGKTITAWRGGWLTLVWGNDEDGVRADGSRLGAFRWSALRNPTNNLRLLPGASCYLVRPVLGRYLSYDASGRFQLKLGSRRFGWLMNEGADTGWRSWPVAF